MEQGKILIVNINDGTVFGWFGETVDGLRADINNIALVELDPHAYENDFLNLVHGIEGIKVTDINKKLLTFDTTPITVVKTDAEKTSDLENEILIAKGVI